MHPKIGVVVLLVVVLGCASTATTVGSATESFQVDGENNDSSVPQQRNPARISDGGNLYQLGSQLERNLTNNLELSSTQLAQGEVQMSLQTIGEGYSENLKQYSEVANQTSSKQDDQKVRRLEEMRRKQVEYINSVRKYQRTLREYERARRNGNTTRTRQLARRLEGLATDTEQIESELILKYDNVSEISDNTTRTNVRRVSKNITATQSEIRESTFLQTRLSATANAEQVSFLEPVNVSGRLTLENGTVVRNKNITILINNQSMRTRTDKSGTFVVRYRPTTVPKDTSSMAVRYVPKNTSDYLGAKAPIEVDIRQVNASIIIYERTAGVSYGDPFVVNGTVTAGERPVGEISLVADVGGERIGTATTGRNGTYSISGTFPADTPPGAQNVSVAFAVTDRAVTSRTKSAPVEVVPTESTLEITTLRNETTLTVTGNLTTTTGVPIPEEPIEIKLDGISHTVVATGDRGQFEAVIDIPEQTYESDSQVNVRAIYQNDSSNINASSAETSISVINLQQGTPGRSSDPLDFLPVIGSTVERFVTVALFVMLLAALAPNLRSNRAVDGSRGQSDDGSSRDEDGDVDGGDNAPRTLERAHEQLETNATDTAIITAYSVVRHQLTVPGDQLSGTQTHWEFYSSCRANTLNDEELSALAELTEIYELTIFSSEDITRSEAESAISASEKILGGG